MYISDLSSEQLTELIRLVKEKEVLQEKLNQVIEEINAIEGVSGASKRRGRPAKTSASGVKGKRLKNEILAALKAAGAEGITVKELSDKFQVDSRNVFSWFYTTGKKIAGLKKIGTAKYALTS